MSAININKNNFQNEIMDSEKTVLLDFWGSLVCSLSYGGSCHRGDCR